MQHLVRISVLAATMAASVAATAAAPAKPLLAPGMRLPTINDCNPEYGSVAPEGVDVSLCEEGKYNEAVKQLEEEKEKQKQQQQQAESSRSL